MGELKSDSKQSDNKELIKQNIINGAKKVNFLVRLQIIINVLVLIMYNIIVFFILKFSIGELRQGLNILSFQPANYKIIQILISLCFITISIYIDYVLFKICYKSTVRALMEMMDIEKLKEILENEENIF